MFWDYCHLDRPITAPGRGGCILVKCFKYMLFLVLDRVAPVIFFFPHWEGFTFLPALGTQKVRNSPQHQGTFPVDIGKGVPIGNFPLTCFKTNPVGFRITFSCYHRE